MASQRGGVWRYHHYDARGHCLLLTGSGGALLEQYDYDAFGFPYLHKPDGSKQGPAAYGNRFLFTGREWLGDLRLYDYRNRMYQPELGRFLQPDPKQFAGGDYNLYRYCHNDPVNKSDPFGLDNYGGYANGWQNPQSDINAFQDRASQGAGNNTFPFNSPTSLLNSLTAAPNITRLDLHGHGVPGAFFTGDAKARLYAAEFKTMAQNIADGSIDIKTDSEIRLFACGQASMAQYLSAVLGKLGRGDIKVTGASGSVSPNKKENETGAKGDFHTYQGGKEIRTSKRLPYK